MKPSNDTIKTIYIIVFFILFTSFKNHDIFSGYNKLLIAGILGGIGAAFGFILYQLLNKKDIFFQCLILIAIAASALLLIPRSAKEKKKPEIISSHNNIALDLKNKLDSIDSVTAKQIEEIKHRPIDTSRVYAWNLTSTQKKNLLTCDVCGYKALVKDSEYCFFCYSAVFDTSVYNPNEKKDWLKNEQLFFFSVDNIASKINFYTPKVENGFIKDPIWKPSVTEHEVKEYSRKMNE
jgi:F0F1-type ATP synthase assembly protein I